MESDKKNYQGGKYLPVPFKPVKMWIKTGYLTNFIETGGIKLPPGLATYALPNNQQGGYNKPINDCPFCENPHKKYTLFKLHPAALNGAKVEFYVCKDCRNVIENEDPIILENVEEQIKETFHEQYLPDNYTPQQWLVEKARQKGEKAKSFTEDDYFKHQTLSVYLRDFLSNGNFPENVLDYSFDKRNKCIWCDSSRNLNEIDFPVTSQFNLIIGRIFMCDTCERNYYDILDRKLIPNTFVSESCVQCKGFYYVSASIHGKRILDNEHGAHHCNTCLAENGLETYPLNTKIQCKGCKTVVMENYDLSLNGKMMDEIYCHKCAEDYGNDLAEKEAMYQSEQARHVANKIKVQESKKVKEDLFGKYNEEAGVFDIQNQKKQTYSRRLFNKRFFLYIVIVFIKSYPSGEEHCYFKIEEGLSKEDEDILRKELESFEDMDTEDSAGLMSKEDLLKGMQEEEYGIVTNLYSSYEDDNLLFSLNGPNTQSAEKILECVDAAHKKASSILYEYERRIRLPM